VRLAAPPGSRWESAAPIALVAGFLIVVYGGLILVLWQIGIFDLDGATNAQVLAPVLALLGAAFGASLTLVGVMLKHSIDVRTFRLAQDTEQRMRLEASIRGIELLATDGKPAPPTQQAGALFALVQLDAIDLAIALLGEIWPRREISTEAAVWVANSALRSDVPRLQIEAATIVSANADTLAREGLSFPDCAYLQWSTKMHVYARDGLLEALVRSLLAKKPDEWNDDILHVYVLQFDAIRKTEAKAPSGRHIWAGAVLSLGLLVHSERYSSFDLILTADGPVAVEAIRKEIGPLLEEATENVSTSIAETLTAAWPTWVPQKTVGPSPRG
jgi:hypothetical protein